MAAQRMPEMGLKVFSAHLVAMPSAPVVWGQAEIFCLGWQRLGTLEGVYTCCNVLPR